MHANESLVFYDLQVSDYLLRHPTFFYYLVVFHSC